MSKKYFLILLFFFLVLLGLISGFILTQKYLKNNHNFFSPLVIKKDKPKNLPLNQYNIKNLKNYEFKISQIILDKELAKYPEYTSYLFFYESLNKKISGQINLPHEPNGKVILMIRGYIDPSNYQTGDGTRSAAAVFAKNGYITLAPDFLGFGQSDMAPEDPWEARFIKPVNIIELIKSVENGGLEGQGNALSVLEDINNPQLGIWAHSNGGQIALSVLEILSAPIPTTLWAPVTAPFPYSILFFSDEDADEGKQARAFIALFEKDYDVFDFSLTKHLNLLTGNILLHHGTADDAALIAWSREFVNKVDLENQKRQDATNSAQLKAINLKYYEYKNADHNLKPVWNQVINQDLEFFKKYLN